MHVIMSTYSTTSNMDFLHRQLSEGDLRLVLLNGDQVIKTLTGTGVVSVSASERIPNKGKTGGYLEGRLFDSTPFVGWTLNLQSTPVSTEHWAEVRRRLVKFANGLEG